MKVVLFCEHKYALSILEPLQVESQKRGYETLWFVDQRNIKEFPLPYTNFTYSIQEVYDFHPEAIFVPGNIVPYYLSGVKAEIFHGYAAEKKDHWVIRRYLDMYLTQGPFFTKPFQLLAQKYKDFEVVETGWTRQDWIYNNLHTYDDYRNELLQTHNKSKIILYAPTFSPSLTSLPTLKQSLADFASNNDVLILLKFHPLTKQEWVEEYKQLAQDIPNILWIDDPNLSKYTLISDMMISDTSSAVYEFLLLDKPVITINNVAKEKYWMDINEPTMLQTAYDEVETSDEYLEKRKWIIENYDPYLDGKVSSRMFDAVEDYISRHGVPKQRKLNLWRRYQSNKKFGKIKR